MDVLAALEIKVVAADAVPRDLLLEADESWEAVSDYLHRGRCYGAFFAGDMVGEYILLHTRPFTAEVVNIAVSPAFRRRGGKGRPLCFALPFHHREHAGGRWRFPDAGRP